MFLRNCWYVAAEPQELAQGIVARTILGERVAIFRTESGAPAALDDRCPHRFVPLSLGNVVGERLRCKYHGSEFDCTGRCVAVPGQDFVPRNVRVKSYPVVEKFGYIWIWMGDPDKADPEAMIPEGFAISGDPAWVGGYGHFESIHADYRIINDNLFDITHAEFVHPESFGGAEVRFYRQARPGTEFIDRGMSFNIEDNSIHFRTHAKELGQEGGPLWRQMLAQSRGLEEWNEPIDFRMEVGWWAPCYTSFHITVRPRGQSDGPTTEIYNLHAAVPETESSTHYFYRSIRNYGDHSQDKQFIEAADFIFGQDKPILEGQQDIIGDRDLFDLDPVSFNGDRLQIEARQILTRLIKAEQSN